MYEGGMNVGMNEDDSHRSGLPFIRPSLHFPVYCSCARPGLPGYRLHAGEVNSHVGFCFRRSHSRINFHFKLRFRFLFSERNLSRRFWPRESEGTCSRVGVLLVVSVLRRGCSRKR